LVVKVILMDDSASTFRYIVTALSHTAYVRACINSTGAGCGTGKLFMLRSFLLSRVTEQLKNIVRERKNHRYSLGR
jgi:hypothetical protein